MTRASVFRFRSNLPGVLPALQYRYFIKRGCITSRILAYCFTTRVMTSQLQSSVLFFLKCGFAFLYLRQRHRSVVNCEYMDILFDDWEKISLLYIILFYFNLFLARARSVQ